MSGFADNDAGGITTYSLAGARFGYSLLWVILASQVVLFFTQEVGARLGLATGKGLMGLIRERWGVRWAAFAAAMMLVANLGSIVAEFAGIGSALSLFGIPPQISAAVAAVVVVSLIALGSYSRIQYLFVAIGLFVSIAYVISANIAHPAWDVAFHSLIVPQLQSSPAYWLMVVGTVGTTITPWGQAFIQSYVADKGLRSGGPASQPPRRVRRRAPHECHRRIHPHRRGGDLVDERPAGHFDRGGCRPSPRAARRGQAPASCLRSACWVRRSSVSGSSR